MTDLDKETYSAAEVRVIIEAHKKEEAVLKQHLAQLAHHIEQEQKKPHDQAPAPVPSAAPDMSIAIQEVKEVERHVKKSIDKVIARAEKIEKLLGNFVFAGKDTLVGEIIKIYEDCNVQDLTSQRVKRVLELLGDEETLKKKKSATTSGGVELEHGPQLPENAMSQEDIDKMLSSL